MSELVIILLTGALSTIFGALIGFWMGIFMERQKRNETKIEDEKFQTLPILENVIKKALLDCAPNILFRDAVTLVAPHYQQLKLSVNGRKLIRLNEAWKKIDETTEKEMCDGSPNGVFDENNHEQKVALTRVQLKLISRFETFKKVVESL
jgi:hypothetical protein